MTLPLMLAVAFWSLLVLAGGASRADALGQVVVRAGAAAAMIATILLRFRVDFARDRLTFGLIAAVMLLLCIQLAPLPPAIWTALPGRGTIARIAPLLGEAQPFRAISLSPDATVNAAFSLVVPIAMMVLLAALSDAERNRMVGAIFLAVIGTAFVGVVQFSGVVVENPLINETAGASSGLFANRNHQALFLAIGVLAAPVWAFAVPGRSRREPAKWRLIAAVGAILWFVLMILATGSRAGLILGAVALVVSPLIVLRDIRRLGARLPRWALPAMIVGVAACIVAILAISIAANRAVSFDRAIAMDVGEDMRARGLPVVLTMIRTYFPIGTGAGAFDPVFRLHEPFALLKLTYFNHAHNDYLEILLDAGLLGGFLLLAALCWWGWRSYAAWRLDDGQDSVARLGSAVILLVLLASATDYPARTPLVMAVLAIASAWLNTGSGGRALRNTDQRL